MKWGFSKHRKIEIYFFSFLRIKYSDLLCVEYPVSIAHPNACVHIVSYHNRVYDGTFLFVRGGWGVETIS